MLDITFPFADLLATTELTSFTWLDLYNFYTIDSLFSLKNSSISSNSTLLRSPLPIFCAWNSVCFIASFFPSTRDWFRNYTQNYWNSYSSTQLC